MNVLSGDRLDTGEMIDKLQSNVSFRITSAREMLTSIRGESSMSPMQRRRQLRQNRLELLGIRDGEDFSSTHDDDSGTTGDNPTPNSSNQIGTSTTTSRTTSKSTSHGTPSMSDVDAGTINRAQNNSFSNTN